MIVLGAHFGALLLILALPVVLLLKIGLAALISASLWWQGQYGMPANVCELKLEDDGSCIRTTNNGEQRRYRIARAAVQAGFIRLILVCAGERMRIQLVPRDAVEPEVYRALCARIVQRHLPVPEKTPA